MSIRTVQTSFASTSKTLASSLDASPWTTSSATALPYTILMGSSLQSHSWSQPRQFPPGLGYDGVDPSTAAAPRRVGRKRSESFTYASGQTFNTPRPIVSPASARRPRYPLSPSMSSLNLPPPASAQGSSSGQFKRSSKFDPFGCDDADTYVPSSSAPVQFSVSPTQHTPIANSGYSHYWQYNPRTNKPVMVCPPTKQQQQAKPEQHHIRIPVLKPITTIPLVPVHPDKETQHRKLAETLLNRIHAVGKPRRRVVTEQKEKEYRKSGLSSVISVEC